MGNKSARKNSAPEQARRAANEAEWQKQASKPALTWGEGGYGRGMQP